MHTFTELITQVMMELTGAKLAAFERIKFDENLATKEAARSIGSMIIEAEAKCILEETTEGHPNGFFDAIRNQKNACEYDCSVKKQYLIKGLSRYSSF